MSAFGLDPAVTTLGHFGTGLTNTFDINDDEPCSLQILCRNVEQLLEDTADILNRLSKMGFRKEKISREDLQNQNNQILIELRNFKRLYQQGLPPGEYNGR